MYYFLTRMKYWTANKIKIVLRIWIRSEIFRCSLNMHLLVLHVYEWRLKSGGLHCCTHDALSGLTMTTWTFCISLIHCQTLLAATRLNKCFVGADSLHGGPGTWPGTHTGLGLYFNGINVSGPIPYCFGSRAHLIFFIIPESIKWQAANTHVLVMLLWQPALKHW